MKIEILKQFNDMKSIIIAGIFVLFLAACNQKPSESAEGEAAEPALTSVSLTDQQFTSLGVKVDTLSKRNFSSVVVANGQLEVLPQNEASVTAIIGANIISIKVFEEIGRAHV